MVRSLRQSGVPAFRTLTMSKPMLLLDVDGVLNVVNRDCKRRQVRFEWRPGDFISFYPTKFTKPLLELAWSRFNVRWCTAWGKGANMIARWAGLEERPAIVDRGGIDWKAFAVERALKSRKGPVAWIEDGLSVQAHALVNMRGWSYFHCDPYIGATEKHLRGLEEFANSVSVRAGV